MSIHGLPIGQSTWSALSPLTTVTPWVVIKVQDDLSRGRKMHCFTSSDDEIWMMGHVSLVLHVQARATRRRHVGGVDLRGTRTRTLGSVLSSVHYSLTEVSQPIRLFSLICLFNDSSFISWFSCFLLKLLLLPYISLSLSLILPTGGR